MRSLVAGGLALQVKSHRKIDRVENKSDGPNRRMRIHFKNGCELSVIRGPTSYGGREGLFEIMADTMDGVCPYDECEDRDDVVGYLTKERVEYYIEKIGNL